MFEKLIDVLLDLSKWLTPVVWINAWEDGVRFTSFGFGMRTHKLGPGLHFKLPIFQTIEHTETAMTTCNLPPQSLTTRDGKSVGASGVITYSIKDVVPLFTKIVHREDALRDVGLGALAKAVRKRTWPEIIDGMDGIETEVRKAIVDKVRGRGYAIEDFTCSDLATGRTIRLMQELPDK